MKNLTYIKFIIRFFIVFIMLLVAAKFIFSILDPWLIAYVALISFVINLLIAMVIGLWKMVKDKHILVKVFFIIIFTMSLGGLYNFSFPKIPVSFDNVKKIELSDEMDGKKVFLTQPEKITEFTTLLKDASGESGIFFKSIPACPFGGMKFTLYYQGKSKNRVEIFFATDDCGTLKYLDDYYDISESDNAKLRSILRKLDVYYQGA